MDTAARASLVRDALNLIASQLSLDGPTILSFSPTPPAELAAAAPAAAKPHAAGSLSHRPQTGSSSHAADLHGSPGISNGPARGPSMLADQQLHPLQQHSVDIPGLSAAAAQLPRLETTTREGPASSQQLASPPHGTDSRPAESSVGHAVQQGLPTTGSLSQGSATDLPFLPPRPSTGSGPKQGPPAGSLAQPGWRTVQPSQAALQPSLASTGNIRGTSPSMKRPQQQQPWVTPRPARLMVALQQRALTRPSREEMLADATWAAQAEETSGEPLCVGQTNAKMRARHHGIIWSLPVVWGMCVSCSDSNLPFWRATLP